MPGPEDPLRRELEGLAAPADPAGAFERILEKKIRRQIYRRLQVAALVFVVLAGTVGGTLVLARVFRTDGHKVARGPIETGTIVFMTNRSPSSQLPTYTMYRMAPNGTNLVQVTKQPVRSPSVRLSRDGSKIAYSVGVREGRGQIVIANADGGDPRVLTTLGDPQEPSWSPDGTRIAFFTGLGVDIYIMPVDGGAPTQLTNPPSDCGDTSPAWSPSGDEIAFVRDCGGRGFSDVYVMNADGSDRRSVTDGSMHVLSPLSWSPDGKRIAFSLWVKGRRQVASINLDGSGFRTLTTEGDNSSPAWSPDGKQIAFTSNRDGNHEIYVMSTDGTGQRNLTHTPTDEFAPSWQPVPSVIVPPSESPTGSPSPIPEPSLSPSPSPPPSACDATVVIGDFDGDGVPDTATVARMSCLFPEPYPYDTPYALDMRWGGAAGTAPLPDCQEICRAVSAADLNHDGADELVLQIGSGASTQFLEIYELPQSEAFANSPATVAPPGAPGFEADQPAVFAIGGSVTHLDFLTCGVGEGGTPEVIATSAKLNHDQTQWSIHETVFAFEGLNPASSSSSGRSVSYPDGQFTVVSTADSTLAFDPTGVNQPQPRDSPCWEVGPSSTPTSVP